MMNRHRLLMALCLCLLAPTSPSQEVADPALELYFAANAAYNRKLYPIAAGNYQSFLARYARHEKAQLSRYGLGLSQFALKQYPAALVEFRKLLEEQKLDKQIERGRLTLLHAQCLLYGGNKNEAQARLVAAASNLPPGVHRTGAIAAVTDLFFSANDWEKTVAWSRKLQAVKAGADQLIRAGYQEGFALYKLDKFPEAIAGLDKTKVLAATEKSTTWVTRINHLLSECHASNKSLDKAETYLQVALASLRGASAVDAQYRLGTIKFSQAKWLEAQADFEVFLRENKKAEKDDWRVREARFHVARCLMEQKETRKADKSFGDLGNGEDEVAGRSILWRGRLYSRGGKYAQAANALRGATDKEWYKKGFSPKPGEKPTTVVADIDFEYANALMLQKQPSWDLALKFLQRVQSKRSDYGQMAEVLSQQAICQHKLEQFEPSYRTTERFLEAYTKHELSGDVRFLNAESLFLLNRLDEAAAAYQAFIAADKGHANQLAARFRVAQVHHHKQEWAKSNQLAVPLLSKKPEGRLFAQLAFVVGENHFRLGKWAEAIDPFESFIGAHVEQPKKRKRKEKGKLTKAPNVDTALMQLGVACTQLGKKEEALGHLGMLVSNYSSDTAHLPLGLSEQGKLLYEVGDLKGARLALERFVKERTNKENKVFQSASAEVGRVHYYLGWIDVAEDLHAAAAKNFALATANSSGRRGKDGRPLASDAALQQGIAMVNAGDFEKAAQHLQDVGKRFKEHPRKDLVIYYTGLAYARVKNWGAAAGFFERVIEEHPKAPFADKAAYEWAWCERSRDRDKQAIERYELLVTQYPESALLTKVQSELAELNLDVGAQDAVIAKLTDTMKSVSDPKLKFELQYQLASAHFKKRDYENSAAMFEALIAGADKSELLPSILFQAGESRLSLTETISARDHYLAAHQTKKNVPPALAESILMRLSETQNMTGQHKEAEKSYRRFMAQYKESQWLRNARYGMAYAMEKQEEYQKAISEYTQLLPRDDKKKLKLDKWMVQARYQIGECYFNLRKYDKATAEFVSVDTNAQGYPDWQAKAVLEMGRILLAQDNKPDAISRMKEVIKRFPRTKAALVAQKYLDALRTGG